MAKPTKIIELSSKDWLKSISIHPYMASGGLFQEATNFDPNEKVGVWVPNLTPTRYGTSEITEDIRSMVSSDTTVTAAAYIHGFADAAKLYRINMNTGTVTDDSERISVGSSDNKGSVVYKGSVVFFNGQTAYAKVHPISRAGTQTTILSGLSGALPTGSVKLHIGPDRNLYALNGASVARITNVNNTTNNAATYLSFETKTATRDLDDDGQHLIIGGDSNIRVTSSGELDTVNPFPAGYYHCFVAFWNMKSQELTRIWGIKDNAVYGIATIEDETLVFCRDNIYTCSVNVRPKVLLPLKGNSNLSSSNPLSPYAIIKRGNNIVMWGAGTTLRGYGRIHSSLPKTFFTAYTVPAHSSFTNIASLFYGPNAAGTSRLWVATDNTNRLYQFDTVTTETSTITIAGIDFKQPYEFNFAKVVLAQKLDTGQSVDMMIRTSETNNTVMRNTAGTSNSFSNANFPGKQSHIFYPYPGTTATSSLAIFEDLSDITIRNVGASVRRIEIWGTPLKQDQDIYT